ncbi:hypothetical protein Taro_019749 [Colocasia esculenta]|uniref:Uncharacterized protein n=1 Tax=Colocasia esculenta TaxID=4460 RepID=A0A843UUD0_COLES|nr:hypothetical protein [Colocasia esculenta]
MLASRGADVDSGLTSRWLASALCWRQGCCRRQHFWLLTGARGKVVMRVAVADRAGNDGSDGGSCEKLLGDRRESRCSCAAFEAVEPCLSSAGLAWLL